MTKQKKPTMYVCEHTWNITHNTNKHVANNGVLRVYVDDYPTTDELQTVHNKFAKKLRKFGYDNQYTTVLHTSLYVHRLCTIEYQHKLRGLQQTKQHLFSYQYNDDATMFVVSELFAYRVAYMFENSDKQTVYTDVVFASSVDDAKPKYGYGSIVSITQLIDMKVGD